MIVSIWNRDCSEVTVTTGPAPVPAPVPAVLAPAAWAAAPCFAAFFAAILAAAAEGFEEDELDMAMIVEMRRVWGRMTQSCGQAVYFMLGFRRRGFGADGRNLGARIVVNRSFHLGCS